MLKVEIPNNAGNGTDYKLVDGVLSVNPGFTGALTAEYVFTTAPTREIAFEYDHNGLRTQKKVVENGITTIYDYTLHGKLITHLTKRVVDLEGVETTEELHFFYDAHSKPAFVEYAGIKYRYIHNLQGDIVAIVDTAGNPVVEYKYDAWGKLLVIGGSNSITLGKQNPLRYRSYFEDEETGLYYMKTRYYCSYVGRFLSEDNFGKYSECIFEDSIFSYGINNPINYIDTDGTFAFVFSSPTIAIPVPIAPSIPTFPGIVDFIGPLTGSPYLDIPTINDHYDLDAEMAKAASKGAVEIKGREVKTPARRIRCNTRKEAYERAKKAGGGKEPIHHNDGKKPHYHPNVKEEYSKTPKGVCKHDHYYYSTPSVSVYGLSEEEFYRRLQEMVAER